MRISDWSSDVCSSDLKLTTFDFLDTRAEGAEPMNVEILAHPELKSALNRLIDLARADTGQSARVTNFLLAWWDGDQWGNFPLTDLFGVDRDVAADRKRVGKGKSGSVRGNIGGSR